MTNLLGLGRREHGGVESFVFAFEACARMYRVCVRVCVCVCVCVCVLHLCVRRGCLLKQLLHERPRTLLHYRLGLARKRTANGPGADFSSTDLN